MAVGQDPEHGEGVGHLWCIDPGKRGDVSEKLVVDKDGKPVYTCRCGVGSNNKRFVSLPNDPQGCNLDPCTPSHTSPLWSEENQTCVCGVDGVEKKDGVCVPVACPYGSWNPLTQQCDCLGQLGKMRCNPGPERDLFWDDPVILCDDPLNDSGWQCIDRCITNYCKHKDLTKCGGPDGNGYRPGFFDDGNAVVCLGGNCNINTDDPSKTCCECPGGTTYSVDPGAYGLCSATGKRPGEGCYAEGRLEAPGGKGRPMDDLRNFWVSYSDDLPDDGQRWDVEDIVYTNHEVKGHGFNYGIKFPAWQQQARGEANVVCSDVCFEKKLGAVQDSVKMKEILNKMQAEFEKGHNSDYARDKIKALFIDKSCDTWSKFSFGPGQKTDTHKPDKMFGNDPDWACGWMCDGKVGEVLEHPRQQC